MNVALFFTYDISLQKWSELDILEREIKLYNKISNDNVKYTFVTYGNYSDYEFSNNLKNIEIIPIYSHIKKHKNRLIRFLLSITIPFRIKKKLKHIDILKTNQLMGSWIPIILKFLLRKKLIIRTGYDLFFFSIKEKKSIIKVFFYFLLTQVSLLSTDKYIVTSKSDYKFLCKWFFLNKKKLMIIHNYVEESDFFTIEKRNDLKILAVGRLEKQKNYKKIIKFVGNSKFELDIFGVGSMEKELKEYAESKGLNNINFLGSLNHNYLLDVYKKYKFYILLSDFEGNPKTLIEAMSRGCIPIVSNTKHLTEIIEDGFNGIVVSDTSEVSIERFFVSKGINKEKLNTISNNAYEYAINNFSLKNIITKELELYSSLMK